MSERSLFQFSLDEEELKRLYLIEVQKRLDKIQMESMLMDREQLETMLNLSWPTITKLFISDPNFPAMKIGNKWAFNRNAVQEYIDRWSGDVHEKGREVDL